MRIVDFNTSIRKSIMHFSKYLEKYFINLGFSRAH